MGGVIAMIPLSYGLGQLGIRGWVVIYDDTLGFTGSVGWGVI